MYVSFIGFETVKDNAPCEAAFFSTYSGEDYRPIAILIGCKGDKLWTKV